MRKNFSEIMAINKKIEVVEAKRKLLESIHMDYYDPNEIAKTPEQRILWNLPLRADEKRMLIGEVIDIYRKQRAELIQEHQELVDNV